MFIFFIFYYFHSSPDLQKEENPPPAENPTPTKDKTTAEDTVTSPPTAEETAAPEAYDDWGSAPDEIAAGVEGTDNDWDDSKRNWED